MLRSGFQLRAPLRLALGAVLFVEALLGCAVTFWLGSGAGDYVGGALLAVLIGYAGFAAIRRETGGRWLTRALVRACFALAAVLNVIAATAGVNVALTGEFIASRITGGVGAAATGAVAAACACFALARMAPRTA